MVTVPETVPEILAAAAVTLPLVRRLSRKKHLLFQKRLPVAGVLTLYWVFQTALILFAAVSI